MSISIWTKGRELHPLLSTDVLDIRHPTENSFMLLQAAKGLMRFSTGGLEDEAKSQQKSEEAKRR